MPIKAIKTQNQNHNIKAKDQMTKKKCSNKAYETINLHSAELVLYWPRGLSGFYT